MSATFFTTFAMYLNSERPFEATTDRMFVALKGPTRGRPLSAVGLDEVLTGARGRSGLSNGPPSCTSRITSASMVLCTVRADGFRVRHE